MNIQTNKDKPQKIIDKYAKQKRRTSKKSVFLGTDVPQCINSSKVYSQYKMTFYNVCDIIDIQLISMSLLIVGSCSRVTQNVVNTLAKLQQYQSITILDLLPTYNFHQRFYNLQHQLSTLDSTTKVNLKKVINIEDLSNNIKNHQDLLFVTHDYFQAVTSKLRLMEITAQLSVNKKAVFATPLEYDHFGLYDPYGQFRTSQQNVMKANPNATFVRSDIQDEAEFLAYLHHPKTSFIGQFTSIPPSFRPQITCSKKYNEAVVEALTGGMKGETHILAGQPKDPMLVLYNKDIQTHQTRHFSANAANLMKEYKGLQKSASTSA